MSTPVAAGTLSASSPAASRVLARRWRRQLAALRESTPATVGIVIVLAWVVLALLAPLIAPYPPNANDIAALAHTTPSRAHWLGTDHLGRDLLSRILWGARPVLVIAPLAVLGAAA
ncbi:MAG: peptide ABC transporter permease, partial [Candidatus Rokuibacteriota bacterium]